MPIALIVSIITTVANTILGVLSGQGVVSTSLSSLIETLIGAGASLFSALKSGGSASSELSAVLTTLQTTLAALQKDTSLSPTVLAQIAESVALVGAGITAFQQAEVTTDPSTLTPL